MVGQKADISGTVGSGGEGGGEGDTGRVAGDGNVLWNCAVLPVQDGSGRVARW